MKTKNSNMLVMAVMTIISFASLLPLIIDSTFNAAGIAVIIGVAWFFISKSIKKTPYDKSGFDIKMVAKDLKNIPLWILIFLPTVFDFGFLLVSKTFFPDFIPHLFERTGFVTWNNLLILIPQLLIFAVGEEIAWRAFYLRQMKKYMPVALAIFINALLFTIGHFSMGSWNVVLFDLASVFIDATVFCIIAHKTDNAWFSSISHFIANLASFFFIILLK